MSNPLVSLIITAYQSNKSFLEEAIESVMNQDYNNLEVLLIDDGSFPSVKSLIDDTYLKKISYHYFDHKGLPYGLIEGVKKSKGKYFAILDQDDRLSDKKSISVRVEALEKTGDGLAHGNMNYIGADSIIYANKKFKQWDHRLQLFNAFTSSIFGPMQHGSVLFNKKLALQEGSYDVNKLAWFDVNLMASVAFNHGASFVDYAVLDSRTHNTNTSNSVSHRLNGLKHKFELIDEYINSKQERLILKSKSVAVTIAKILYFLTFNKIIQKGKVTSYFS